jgi:hypothetical protein
MKITNKRLRFLGGLVVLAGAIVNVLTEGVGRYIAIGIMVLGIIVMMPWVNEKKE